MLWSRFGLRKRKKNQHKKLNNQGSSFVLVIVSLALIMILVAIIFVMIFMQYRMLAMNRQSKSNFYYLEETLEEMRVGVGNESVKQLKNAYDETVSMVVYYDANQQKYMTVSSETAQSILDNKYLNYIAKKFCTKSTSTLKDASISEAQLKALLLSYVKNVDTSTYTTSDNVKITFGSNFSCKAVVSNNPVKTVGYVINDITVSRTDKKGNEQSITTDISIYPPKQSMNFTASSDDVSNIFTYAWVADYGIQVSGGATSDVRVVGNVYAGADYRNNGVYGGTIEDIAGTNKAKIINSVAGGTGQTDASAYSGVFVTGDGTKLKLQSDIVAVNGSITADSGGYILGNTKNEESIRTAPSIIWANNIATTGSDKGSEITLNGQFNISDDLELNAKKSKVTLLGNYYGYNYAAEEEAADVAAGTTGSGATNQITAATKPKQHTNSSAIIINGENSTLDLNQLSVMVVNGRSYIDLLSEKAEENDHITNDIKTAESVSVKSTQLVYRVVESQNINADLPALHTTGTKVVGSNNTELTTAVPYYNMIKFLTYQFIKDEGYRIYNTGNAGSNNLYNSDWAGIGADSYEKVWKDIRENGTSSKYYQGIIDVYFPRNEKIVREGNSYKKVTNASKKVKDCYGNEYHIFENVGSIATAGTSKVHRYGFITVGDQYQYVSLVKTVTGADKDEYYYYQFYNEDAKKEFVKDFADYTAHNKAIDDVTKAGRKNTAANSTESEALFQTKDIALPDEDDATVYTRGLYTVLDGEAKRYKLKASRPNSQYDEHALKDLYDSESKNAKVYNCYFPRANATISASQQTAAEAIYKTGTRPVMPEAKFEYDTKGSDISPLTNPGSINIDWRQVAAKEATDGGKGVELKGYTGARIWVSMSDITIDGNAYADGKVSGIVICKGNVTIKNLKEFTGTVICAGKLNVTGTTTFNSDEQMCNNMIQNDTSNMIRTCFGIKEYDKKNDNTDKGSTVSSITYKDLVGFENWIKNGE